MNEEETPIPYIDYGKMSSNGQITINVGTRERLNIKQGDIVYFRVLAVQDDFGLTKWEDTKEKERLRKERYGEKDE
ncbi:MAG: hypothetical protein ACOC80_09210 [Petrotogales bacterium]